MFITVYKETHPARMKRIKELSGKQYIDDGPLALYHALICLQNAKHSLTLEACLLELERLYNLPPFEKKD